MRLYQKEFQSAFQASVPVMLGYLVLGFSFGLLGVSMGLAWYWPVLMSLLIYAGALQFLALGMIEAKTGFGSLFIASLFVNSRQAFYGLSLLNRFRRMGSLKPYMIFALTDETYALLTTLRPEEGINRRYYAFYLTLLDHLYWVTGTLAGALFGAAVHFDSRGIDFALTALFVVLAIEQYKTYRTWIPFALGAFASVVAIALLPERQVLLGAIVIALAGMFTFRPLLEKGDRDG